MNLGNPVVPDLDRAGVEALLAKADAGDSREWTDLCQWALSSDMVLRAYADARANAAVAAFRPTGKRIDQMILEDVSSLSASLCLIALQAPALGFALVEMGFAPARMRLGDQSLDLLAVERLYGVNPPRVRFAHDTDEPMLDFPAGPKPLPADKFLVVSAKGYGIAIKRGYMRRAIFPVLERQQLLATVTARLAERSEGATAKETAALDRCTAEIGAIVMEGMEFDGLMLDDAMRRVAATVRKVNAEVLAGLEVAS